MIRRFLALGIPTLCSILALSGCGSDDAGGSKRTSTSSKKSSSTRMIASERETLAIYQDGVRVGKIPDAGFFSAAHPSPDGRYAVIEFADATSKKSLVDLRSKKVTTIDSAVTSPFGWLGDKVLCSSDGAFKLLDPVSGAIEPLPTVIETGLLSGIAATARDGTRGIIPSNEEWVMVDEQGTKIDAPTIPRADFLQFWWSQDASTLVGLHNDLHHGIGIWNMEDGTSFTKALDGHAKSVAVSPDGSHIAVATYNSIRYAPTAASLLLFTDQKEDNAKLLDEWEAKTLLGEGEVVDLKRPVGWLSNTELLVEYNLSIKFEDIAYGIVDIDHKTFRKLAKIKDVRGLTPLPVVQ